MNTTAGTREEVKEVLLTAAKLFDTYCSFIGFKSKFGVQRPSMFDAMSAYMNKPGSKW